MSFMELKTQTLTENLLTRLRNNGQENACIAFSYKDNG
jgi:hypothetical protein